MKHHRGRNEGSISRRPNGSWRGQVFQSGSRLSKDFRSKSEALTWIRTIQSQIDHGYLIRGSNITLNEYMNAWLENRRLALREKTAYQYSSILKNHILPVFGETRLRDLKLAEIENHYSRLIENGKGPRTVHIVHNILHASMEKAVKHGLIVRNPAHGATLPSYPRDEMRVLDPTQISRFLDAARPSQYYALYHLAITTGMRLGELLGLKWSDLDWKSGIIQVKRQKQDVPGQRSNLVEPKTRSGRRSIYLG